MLGRSSLEQSYLGRIEAAIDAAKTVTSAFECPAEACPERQRLVRELELRLSQTLRDSLLAPGEGWLCEEHADDAARLKCDVVWVVDPMDGTIECCNGIPEWTISVGVVVQGAPIAGGIYNPSTQELFLGSPSAGVTYNGESAQLAPRTNMEGAVVVASRQEVARGQWARFEDRNFSIRPVGSIAYKLALVSAGLADATWTLSPKHEWDVAAGVALVLASGGEVGLLDGSPITCNRQRPLFPGLIASSKSIWREVNSVISSSKTIQASASQLSSDLAR